MGIKSLKEGRGGHRASRGIAQSGVTDWSTVPWAQYPNLFLDPAQGTVPVMVVTLVPGAGKDVADGHTGLSLATSQGVATQHGAIPLTQFDVSISFSQLKNAIRIISAKFLNQPVGTDTACAQCSKVFGASCNDPGAWVAIFVQVEQEDHDPSGKSGAILGGFSWLYVGGHHRKTVVREKGLPDAEELDTKARLAVELVRARNAREWRPRGCSGLVGRDAWSKLNVGRWGQCWKPVGTDIHRSNDETRGK
jgi:hypothetical protein